MDATASTTSASAEPTTTSGKRSDRLSIKFLISNSLAGVLIGSGGTAIKDLIDISGARVIVSSISDVYPGTSDRIALISGSQASVDLAQRLVWDMIATATVANEGSSSTGEKKTFSWNPRTAHENLERHNDTNVSGRVTISAAAAGLILGKGGASLRAISEEGGARLQMNSKDESIFTHERIISISGSTEACARSLTAVINKLSEDLSSAQFLNSGVTYTTHINPHSITGGIHAQTSGDGRRGRGRSVRGAPAARDNAASSSEVAASEISTSTEITINIPDSAIGNILGKQGITMKEIMSLSGAKIVVTPRAAHSDGNSIRVVTVTGSPNQAQTAHYLINQKLSHPSTAQRRGGGGGAAGGATRRTSKGASA